MKKLLVGLLIFGIVLYIGCTPEKTDEIIYPKILAIGNSFSEDGMRFLYDMLQQTGVSSNPILVNAYISGCDLYTHTQNAKSNSASYTRQTIGTRGTINWSDKLFTLKNLIEQNKWDIITLQQQSLSSGKIETYNDDLDYLIDYVKRYAINSNVKLGWHMTWAYADNTNLESFDDFNNNQRYMYQQICNAVTTKILPKTEFEFIIPAGTAIQNARLHFGDFLTDPEDGIHLNNLGCYVVAVTWLKAIAGCDVAKLITPYYASATAEPVTIDKTMLEKIVQSVNAAVEMPFESPDN